MEERKQGQGRLIGAVRAFGKTASEIGERLPRSMSVKDPMNGRPPI
jgi:hypothetical protein